MMDDRKPVLKEVVDYKLPNGLVVQLGPLKQENFENLNKWIRRKYMQNIRSVLEDFPLDEQEKLLNRAVKDAALMSVKTEEGLQVLYESVHGYARLCYELIKTPPLTFAEFDSILFPDHIAYATNTNVLSEMFFSVYDEMFFENLPSMFSSDVLSEMGVDIDNEK